MKMHGCVISWFEVKHPRAEIVRAEKMVVLDLLRPRLVDLMLQVDAFHSALLDGLSGVNEPIAVWVRLSIGPKQETRGLLE
jgi:hypothetical protein